MTGLDVTAYRTAAGDATRAAQSVQRELSSLDPDGAIQGIDHHISRYGTGAWECRP